MTSIRKIHILPRILFLWYLNIFLSTEILSRLHLINRTNLLIINIIFSSVILFLFRKEIKDFLYQIYINSKREWIILLIFILTFIQGIGSAPSTTDAMGYHLSRVMHWLNSGTTIQTYIINFHDFMPPFPEYIQMHLYSITDSDRLIFLSQWIAFVTSVFLCGAIFIELKGNYRLKSNVMLLAALTPIALLEATSAQTDLQSNIFILLAIYITLILIKEKKIFYALILGVVFGLGMLTKQTFAAFAIIPASLLLYLITRDWKKGIVTIMVIIPVTVIIQLSFFSQNVRLYGNFMGQNLKGEENVFFNEVISPQFAFSNMLKNACINIPIPVGKERVEGVLTSITKFIGADINDPRANHNRLNKFRLLSMIYPQEDMVSNPINLALILITGVSLIIFWKKVKNTLAKYLYIFLIISFMFFSLILNWNLYNIRLEIPMFMVGVILAFLILNISKTGRKILSISLIFSIPIGLFVILFNVARPYISYSSFYEKVKAYAPRNSSIPEAFYIRPRDQQYFNARYYWLDSYNKITDSISINYRNPKITIDLMDEFEYPLWALLKNKKVKFVYSSNKEANYGDLIISTSKSPYVRESYKTICYKTPIDYGYACLSEKIYR